MHAPLFFGRQELYLPGTEVTRAKPDGAAVATRYCTRAGQTFAAKTTGGTLTWLVTDISSAAMKKGPRPTRLGSSRTCR